MTKPDLNDFAWFVHVVEEAGFAAAGRALVADIGHVEGRIALFTHFNHQSKPDAG